MSKLSARSFGTALIIVVAGWLGVSSAWAAPSIARLSVRGLQAGGTTALVIEGSELGPNTVLLTTTPGVTMQVRPSSTPQRIEADVSVDAQTPPGIYLLRVASATGVSNGIAVGIDALPQMAFAPQLATLPAALSGELTGSAVLNTSFAGKQGQRVVAEVESQRLGGKLKPVVRILNSRRTQIAWSKPTTLIDGDARCEAVLPADDTYSVELHDLIYRGEGPGVFRLKLGDLQYADLTFPLGVESGKAATLDFLSTSFPSNAKASDTVAGFGIEPAPWPAVVALISGSRPKLAVNPFSEIAEQRSENKPQELSAAPIGVSGKVSARGEHDLYRLPVTPGQVLRFEVFSHRLGLPADLAITIMNEQQGGLASNDDLPGTKDPGLSFTVSQGVNAILVGVRDALNLADSLAVYRLQITPEPMPDFSLSLPEDVKQVPAGGTALLRVHADRRGYAGPIRLSVAGVANGLLASEATIEPDSSDALISIAAPANGGTSCLVNIVGESVGLNPPLRRTAFVPDAPVYGAQPWSRRELAIGAAPAAPLTVAWDLPTSADGKLAIASRVPLHVKVDRTAGVTGAVQIAVVSALNVPQKRILENNQPKPVDDIDRTLHLDGAPIIAADQNELSGNLIVPFDLTSAVCDATVRAELLGADNKSVVPSVFAPIRRLQFARPAPEQPLTILEDQPEFVAALQEGGGQITLHEAEKFSGKASVRVTPDQKFNGKLPGLAAKIRENPAPGEYRYLRFAWKKPAGNVALQLAHDGQFGPIENRSFRYQAGPGAEFGGMAIRIDAQQPAQFTVVTRDLFADFGEFTMTGVALTAIDGDAALFDHIYLGRTPTDFDLVKP